MTSSLIGNNVSTKSNEVKAQVATQYKQRYVFILQLHSGEFVIGSATNASKRCAAINSGLNKAIPKPLQVNRIIGIKPCNEERNLPGVVAKYCARFGTEKVIVV